MVQYRRTQLFPLDRNLYGHPMTALLWERQFENILLNYVWEKVSNWECLFVHREKRMILICVCGWHKNWLETNKNIDPMWKVLNKEVDLGEPTSFLHHENLGCTQRQCENKQRYCLTITESCFESRISAGENWKTTMLGKYVYLFVVLRYGRSRQEMPRAIFVSWQNRDDSTTLQSIISMHLMTIIFKEEKRDSWENCQKYTLNLFWNTYIWHVLEDLIFYGQWTNLHDRSQNGPTLVTNAWIDWSLTFIIHVKIKKYCHMGKHCQTMQIGDCFKTLILQEILRIENLRQMERYAFFGSHTFVPISWDV